MACEDDRKAKGRFRYFSFVMLVSCGAWSMMNAFQASYWQYFMTDVCLMSAAVAGTCLTIGSAFELVSCFLAGPMMEKIRLPWGKHRSWLVVAPPFVTACFLLMFTDYGLPETATAALMVTGYCLANFGINAGTTLRNLAISVGGHTPREQAILSTKKGQGSSVGTFVFGLIGFNCILLFNGGDAHGTAGYQAAVLMFGALFLITHLMLFKCFPRQSDERVKRAEQSKPVSFRQTLSALMASPSFAAILVADSLRYIARATMLGIIMYYFQYVLGDVEASSIYFSASGIIAMVGSFLAEALVRRLSKRTLYLAGYVIMIACCFAMFAFGTSVGSFIVLSCGWFFGLSFVNSSQIGLYADGIDYGIYRNKVDCRLWLMSLTTIPPRIGNFGKALVVGVGLAAIGYSAHVAPTPEIVLGIRGLACIAPALLMVVGLVVLLKWFTLDDGKMIEIREELAACNLRADFEE